VGRLSAVIALKLFGVTQPMCYPKEIKIKRIIIKKEKEIN